MNGNDPETQPAGGRPSDTPKPLSSQTVGHAGDAVRTRAAEAVPPPARIGPFSILKTLGRGGMGTVYLARDEERERDVALKVIPSGPDADPTDLARFRTEAEAVARLDHPNIVKLYEVGEGEGVSWLAMEYVDGGSLYRRIAREGPFNPTVAAEITEQVARATHYAHTRGVIHRDLKPSNILLESPQSAVTSPRSGDGPPRTSNTSPGTPKIADFGLAKQLDRSLRLTQAGTAIGTPHYMAPEQARGLNDQVGPAADVHAIGAILYELLTGHPPYGGNSALETMEQVVNKKPVPPSHLRNGIPPLLESICLKCLEKSPARRFRTAEALADALRTYLDGPPDTSRPAGFPAVRKEVWWYRLGVVAAAGVVFAVLAGTAAWFVTGRAHRADVRSAREQAEAASRSERRARFEVAIALCDRGQVGLGLDRMRTLPDLDDLPIRESIAAWESRLLRRPVQQPTSPARVASLSPRGDRLATVSGNTVQLWRTADWSADGDAWPADAEVTALAWSDDGERLAAGTADGRVLLGSIAGRRFAADPVIRDLGRAVGAVVWSGPGVRYTLAGDAPPGGTPDARVGAVTGTALSPISEDSAVALASGAVRVYDAADRRWRDVLADGDASAVAYAADGNVLAIGTRTGAVRLWDAISLTPFTDAFQLGRPIATLTVAAVGREYAVVAGTDNGPAVALRCGRPFHAPPIRLAEGAEAGVLGVTFTPQRDGLYVTSSSGVSLWRYGAGGRYVRERDFSAGSRYPKAEAAGEFTTSCVCEATGSLLVGGSAGRVFRVDPETSHDVAAADMAGVPTVNSLAVSADGKQVCACGRSRPHRSIVRHWSAGFEPGPSTVRQVDCGINHQAFLPDGSALVVGCDDGTVRVWDPVAGTDVRPALHTGSPVLAVAVREDGKRVLAGCADGSARLWDLESGAALVVVRHSAEVRAVAFHGADLVTASADGTARRWHAGTGLPLGPAMPHADAATALAVWRDLAATGGRGRYVRVWRLN